MISCIPAKNANTAAAILSLISFLSLLLLNFGTPTIESIYIASVEVSSGNLKGQKIIFGLYGACLQATMMDTKSRCTNSNDGLDSDYIISNTRTKFLLSMHAVAMGGQIDLYLQVKNDIPIHGISATLGASGFLLVVVPLILSILSIFIFYIGEHAVTKEGGIPTIGTEMSIQRNVP
ncbi:5555_t:CDS:2 [Entrophospora sp. SA101]|nr:5555_t:CDS:2 [Entrophospora sp. SA101]